MTEVYLPGLVEFDVAVFDAVDRAVEGADDDGEEGGAWADEVKVTDVVTREDSDPHALCVVDVSSPEVRRCCCW